VTDATPTPAQLFDLTGKVALVTGGSRGLGKEMVLAFAAAGADVVIASRKLDNCKTLAEVVVATTGRRALPVACHVGHWAECDELAERAYEHFGQVDILVNNAGVFTFAPAHAIGEADYEAMMDTNVKAPFFLTAALAPSMTARGHGRVINITTMVASFGMPGASAYGASKAALDLLTKAWAVEYGPHGINVNAISPGPVRTEGTEAMGDGLDQLAKLAPAGRPARPEEIAAAALYLASDESGFVHGVTLAVDGGRLAA
jgi:NAD(P)-dependent dehydrogenase (short-subunit alcohol dehydrogenase family)